MSVFKNIFPALLLFAFTPCVQAQDASIPKVPADSITLKNIKGKMVSYGDLARKSPIILICFWSVNSDASIEELNAIAKQYDHWRQMASFTLLPVCVDQGSLVNRMRPTANENGWTFDTYADISGDLQRLLGYSNVPQSMVVQKGEVVFRQAGYSAGSEGNLFNKVLMLSPVKGGPVR